MNMRPSETTEFDMKVMELVDDINDGRTASNDFIAHGYRADDRSWVINVSGVGFTDLFYLPVTADIDDLTAQAHLDAVSHNPQRMAHKFMKAAALVRLLRERFHLKPSC